MRDADTGWRPSASIEALRQRAQLLQSLRVYFAAAGVLEVETPYISVHGTVDPQIDAIPVQALVTANGYQQASQYLHTSPEFAMKRLLAADVGDIYQIARVFRDGEAGRHHNPEFTLLEWYRVGFDHQVLMRDVDQLVQMVAEDIRPLAESQYVSYQALFLQHTGVDVLAEPSSVIQRLQTWLATADHGLQHDSLPLCDDYNELLDMVMSFYIQPMLGRDHLCFVYDYPASQASLANIRHEDNVAERFEVFLDGVELGNGFHELLDADEQAARFQQEQAQRATLGKPLIPYDEHLIAALHAGMPECAGVALGVDRLMMALYGHDSIAQTLAFTAQHA